MQLIQCYFKSNYIQPNQSIQLYPIHYNLTNAEMRIISKYQTMPHLIQSKYHSLSSSIQCFSSTGWFCSEVCEQQGEGEGRGGGGQEGAGGGGEEETGGGEEAGGGGGGGRGGGKKEEI